MALLWIEGFEGFGNTPGGAPVPTSIIAKKYPSVGQETNIDIEIGRTGGYSLQFQNNQNYIRTHALTTDDTMIVGVAFSAGSLLISGSFLRLYEDTQLGMNVHVNLDGTLDVYRNVTLLGSTTNTIVAGVWYYFEFKVVNHQTAGSYELRVNDTTWLSDSGIDTQTVLGYHSVVEFRGPFSFVANNIDDVYICDGTGTRNNDFLGNVKVVAIRPDSAGDDTDWTPAAGANYAAVDEVVLDEDTTYVETSGSGDQDLYNYEALSSVGSIKGIQIITEVRVTDATSYDLNAVIKSNTTEDDGDPETITSTSYVTHIRLEETDPDTSDTWQAAAVNACQFGIKAT